jgi:hypothetical protein
MKVLQQGTFKLGTATSCNIFYLNKVYDLNGKFKLGTATPCNESFKKKFKIQILSQNLEEPKSIIYSYSL